MVFGSNPRASIHRDLVGRRTVGRLMVPFFPCMLAMSSLDTSSLAEWPPPLLPRLPVEPESRTWPAAVLPHDATSAVRPRRICSNGTPAGGNLDRRFVGHHLHPDLVGGLVLRGITDVTAGARNALTTAP